MSHSDQPTAAADELTFAELVDRAADMVRDGIVATTELETEPHHDQTDQDLRDAVDDALQSEGDESESSNQINEPRAVDWAALWAEFGFDTVDATGSKIISDTQLQTALECTEQALQGGPEGHIRSGLTQEQLLKRESNDGALQGYIYVGGNQ